MEEVSNPKQPASVSRRRFLGVVASVAGGAVLRSARGATGEPRLHVPPGLEPSKVVVAQNSRLVNGPDVHRALLGETFEQMLLALTGKSSTKEAWGTILRPDDVVGLKFNRSGQDVIRTTTAMADALVASLVDAGWGLERIVLVEAPPGFAERAGTQPPWPGYDSHATDFGSGSDQFASVLRQITALISVPFLKTHNIAGMTCALKNLSHGLIKHPARYHANGCSPYIADVVASSPIRSKLRLALVDAMRVVYDGGPRATAVTLGDEGALLISRDPVAADSVALEILNRTRERHGLEPIAASAAEIPYLAAAHERGLGIAVRHATDVVRILGP